MAIFSCMTISMLLSSVRVPVRTTISDLSPAWWTFSFVPYSTPQVTRALSPDGAPREGSHATVFFTIIVSVFSSL